MAFRMVRSFRMAAVTGDLAGTARGDQAVKERPDHGIVLDRRDRGHVQAASDVRTPADNHPPAAEGAAIAGHRGQPGEGGNAPAIQRRGRHLWNHCQHVDRKWRLRPAQDQYLEGPGAEPR
jgi:hypothetical protein